MLAAAVRAAGGHVRRGRCMTRVLWFMMPSSGLVIVLAAASVSGLDAALPGEVVMFARAVAGLPAV